MPYSKHIPHGIMFHHFYNEKHPKGQGAISQKDFEKIINYIGVERFLSPVEWLEKLNKNQLQNNDLCLTFDDGLFCQTDIALPVLEQYRLKAFWFVYSGVFEGKLENLEIYRIFRTKYFDNVDDFYRVFFKKVFASEIAKPINPVLEEKEVAEQRRLSPFYSVNDIRFHFIRDTMLGRQKYEYIMDSLLQEYEVSKIDLANHLWMSEENLKYLTENGHMVGLHSYSHPTMFATLTFQEQFEEYQKNYSHLKRVCGKNPLVMSHPCNSYNEDTLIILGQLGIRCGFRANMFPAQEGGGRLNASNLEIAREDHANLMAILK